MKKIILLTSIIVLTVVAFGQKNSLSDDYKAIKIEWAENIKGNFSFKNKWSYPEGVYKNRFGQLSCDGFCPEEIDEMKDGNGKIKKKFLKAFYKFVDTTHKFHTIQCDAWCYGWGGTNFIDIERKNADTVECATQGNAGTYSGLLITIVNDYCYPRIDFASIIAGNDKIYTCTGGTIKIDRKLWSKGIMKAEFSFNFDHPEDPKQPMFWKGKIYAKIEKKRMVQKDNY